MGRNNHQRMLPRKKEARGAVAGLWVSNHIRYTCGEEEEESEFGDDTAEGNKCRLTVVR